MITIEKGIPIPSVQDRHSGSEELQAFVGMDFGDSFVCDTDAVMALRTYVRVNLNDCGVVERRVGPGEARVWKIKKPTAPTESEYPD